MIQALLLSLALGAAPSQDAGQGTVTVDLPAQAEVGGVEFTLADIATVGGSDTAAAQRVGSLHLGYTPAPGYSRLLEAGALVREMRASFPGVELSITGASACRIVCRVQRIEGVAVGALAKAELSTLFRGRDVELTMHGRLQDVSVPQGTAPARMQARLRELAPRPGSWSVPVEILVDGSVARTIWTSWTVDEWQERDVLVRDVPRGGTLTPEDIQRRRVLVKQHDTGRPIEKAALRGATARRDLHSGEIVHLSDVEREVVIRRGDMVHVEVKKGAITARGAGVAQEDGRIGDSVRVVMSSTQAEVVATAAGRERVEIRMN